MTPETVGRLAAAVAAVYDVHDVPEERRIRIEQPSALYRAKIVADTHANHNGDWAYGSCDAELFALEWEIWRAEQPEQRITWRDRLRVIWRALTVQ